VFVCVNQGSTFYGWLSASENFCVNVLSFPHLEISKGFSDRRLNSIERFATGHWTVARELPYLIGAQANLFCKTGTVTHFGTHGISIGRVEYVRRGGCTSRLPGWSLCEDLPTGGRTRLRRASGPDTLACRPKAKPGWSGPYGIAPTQGHTSYNELMAPATNQIQTILSILK
jgi:hypothetical protein